VIKINRGQQSLHFNTELEQYYRQIDTNYKKMYLSSVKIHKHKDFNSKQIGCDV